jgi:hypothetical protein
MDEHVVFITYTRAVMSEFAGIRADLIRGSGRPCQFATPHYHSNIVEGTDQVVSRYGRQGENFCYGKDSLYNQRIELSGICSHDSVVFHLTLPDHVHCRNGHSGNP